ncbi:MAG: LPS-assembly lipoprotein [Candidatus Tokpelaia sp. JSC188]|nr:MAG: LPS-assembly lipoprotein [Candidatus Tokpelaia sp. JSC188]
MACIIIISLLVTLLACSIQPLYFSKVAQIAPDMHKRLSSIVIDNPNDHMTQLVRNQLIFLLSAGSGQPITPDYQLTLNIRSYVQTSVSIDIGDRIEHIGRPSVGTVTVISNYILKNSEGKSLAMRKRSVTSSFDRPQQEYANLTAEENARKRAAEELAEQIFLSLTQDVFHH